MTDLAPLAAKCWALWPEALPDKDRPLTTTEIFWFALQAWLKRGWIEHINIIDGDFVVTIVRIAGKDYESFEATGPTPAHALLAAMCKAREAR